MKRARSYPPPPWSYRSDGVTGLIPPNYALVGKPVVDESGKIITFQLVLEHTESRTPAGPDQMNAFMQAILDTMNTKHQKETREEEAPEEPQGED